MSRTRVDDYKMRSALHCFTDYHRQNFSGRIWMTKVHLFVGRPILDLHNWRHHQHMKRGCK